MPKKIEPCDADVKRVVFQVYISERARYDEGGDYYDVVEMANARHHGNGPKSWFLKYTRHKGTDKEFTRYVPWDNHLERHEWDISIKALNDVRTHKGYVYQNYAAEIFRDGERVWIESGPIDYVHPLALAKLFKLKDCTFWSRDNPEDWVGEHCIYNAYPWIVASVDGLSRGCVTIKRDLVTIDIATGRNPFELYDPFEYDFVQDSSGDWIVVDYLDVLFLKLTDKYRYEGN